MASALTVPHKSVTKLRHSAHGVRPTDPHKQLRIERSKSTTPSIHVDSATNSDLYDYEEDTFDGSDKKFKETTMFLTAVRRMTLDHISRCQTPLEVQDLSEDELDSYYFDDPESEPTSSKFDEQKNYISMCEKDELLPSSSFLRQINKPRCNLSCLALTEKDIRPIAVALVNNSKITEVDLSENELGKFGMRHIAESLTENVFITRAKLSRVGLDAQCMKYLVQGLKGNKTLTCLDISTNHLNANTAVHIAKMIQENDFITELILRENDLDDESGRIMASAIASNLTIRKLDLSWNHIRGRGASDIVKAVCENVELLDVDLSYNGLGEEGSIAFGKNFQKNHTLRMLDISNCRINFLHLGHVLKGLKANDTLESLKITGNPFTTDGAIAILKCLENSSRSALKDLFLEDTPINDDFLVAYDDLQTKRDITVHHKEPNRKKISSIMRERQIEDHDPLLLLFELMRQENFRLVDLFRNFDKNNDNRISKEELKDGFLKFSIELPEEKLKSLMKKLDSDDNNVVDLSELISGRRKAAYTRHVANKDSTGRMAESLKHLKTMVEKKFSIELPEEKLKSLMKKLDSDDNNVVDLSELISGRRKAAYTRHVANKDYTGRMAESLKHLKTMVEKKFSIGLPEEKLKSLMKKLDSDDNNVVDLSELICGRRKAAYARHVANKDSTGRMAESLKHLKTMVEKVRKEKYQETHNIVKDKKTDSEPTDNSKQLYRRPSMTAIIQVPIEMKEKVHEALK